MKTVLAVMLFGVLAAAQDPIAEALRKGIIEEDANHNLNAAIQTYQSVLTQFNADRQTAATALFRLAECYRKQGKNDQAAAAYKRVIQDFGEQTKLVDQSRRYLPKPKESAAALSPADASRWYREILEREIEIASTFLAYVHGQYERGAISEMDTYDAQRELTEAQRALVAFDAGLQPQPLDPPADGAAAKARAQYRSLLQDEIDFAQKDYEAQKLQYTLGAKMLIDVLPALKKTLDLQLQLAAFDMNAAAPAPIAPAK
ncbi:MAG: tetratricopeptide repeat protein [Bryobacteraceae bacterium]|jgi:tetratricopeptide (TPR) repeat protein